MIDSAASSVVSCDETIFLIAFQPDVIDLMDHPKIVPIFRSLIPEKVLFCLYLHASKHPRNLIQLLLLPLYHQQLKSSLLKNQTQQPTFLLLLHCQFIVQQLL